MLLKLSIYFFPNSLNAIGIFVNGINIFLIQEEIKVNTNFDKKATRMRSSSLRVFTHCFSPFTTDRYNTDPVPHFYLETKNISIFPTCHSITYNVIQNTNFSLKKKRKCNVHLTNAPFNIPHALLRGPLCIYSITNPNEGL